MPPIVEPPLEIGGGGGGGLDFLDKKFEELGIGGGGPLF